MKGPSWEMHESIKIIISPANSLSFLLINLWATVCSLAVVFCFQRARFDKFIVLLSHDPGILVSIFPTGKRNYPNEVVGVTMRAVIMIHSIHINYAPYKVTKYSTIIDIDLSIVANGLSFDQILFIWYVRENYLLRLNANQFCTLQK